MDFPGTGADAPVGNIADAHRLTPAATTASNARTPSRDGDPMGRATCLLLGLLLALPASASRADDTRFGPADLVRIADLGEPTFSPDGRDLAYVVSSANLDADLSQSDLWRVGSDGQRRMRLTDTPQSSEWRPQWRRDGRAILFLSDRKHHSRQDDADATTQVWTMPARGGRARRITGFADGVEDFALSPDGTRLVVVARDPQFPAGTPAPINPPPIFTERLQFKEDGAGYLDHRRLHLHLVDIASGDVVQLTDGAHDEQLPAWSPDGTRIAYVGKRGDDPDRHLDFNLFVVEARAGGRERQLTTFPGPDLDPDWESRPDWSPDGRRIAYLQGGEPRWLYYAPPRLAIVDVDSGATTLPAPVDHWMYKPRWSLDGDSVLVLVEHSLATHVSRIDIGDGTITPLTQGARFDADFAVSGDGRIALLGGTDRHPHDIAILDAAGPRRVADHNAWLDGRRLASTEPVAFDSADGTRIEGLLVHPVDAGPGPWPTILRVHGGPVYQFSHEFMADWQVYATHGYAVLAVNPRGSSGRGFDFAKAIFADWGRLDTQDLLAGIDHLVARGIADPQRLGIGGWSYGGILTDAVIARDARFKAAISGAGVANVYGTWGHDQYIREYTLELGTPWANGATYDHNSAPFLHADRIRTPTMFQCAERDFNVPCIGAEQMYQALRVLGVPTQLVVYPGEHHGLSVPSYLRDRIERNLAWYDRFLQATAPP